MDEDLRRAAARGLRADGYVALGGLWAVPLPFLANIPPRQCATSERSPRLQAQLIRMLRLNPSL